MFKVAMVRRLLILLYLSFFIVFISYSQTASDDQRLRDIVKHFGQAEVSIPYADDKALDYLTRQVSILSVSNKIVDISLSPLTVEWFIQQRFDYVIKETAEIKGVITATSISQLLGWEVYPTYAQYDSVMRSFVTLYPDLCRLDTIGTSINGKLILAVKISDNPGIDEAEPEVFYSSSMHGNELGGFVLMLRLAEFLLDNYNNSERVKNLVDNLEIWINPLANPDGTYGSGNEIISPVRFNANGVDLNRDFPDPLLANTSMQKETVDMINFMRGHRFVLSANFHSGAEVVNYPWDRWKTRYHADDEWFNAISRAYADTVHVYSGPGYMVDLDNGVTRGSDWYVVYGGRQDFVTLELHGREVTIELDDQYLTPVSQLSSLWENNWRSLLGYIENSLTGVHGYVLNSSTSAPVPAKIFISGHDKDSSQVYSDTLSGNFVRLIAPGIWTLSFTADGYNDTVRIVEVVPGKRTDIIVTMTTVTNPVDTLIQEAPVIYPNPSSSEINAILSGIFAGPLNIKVFNNLGKIFIQYDTEAFRGVPLNIDVRRLSAGIYSVVFTNKINGKSCKGRFIIIK